MEVVQEKRLIFTDVIKDGVSIGTKNIIPLILTTVLYVLTCWIPYLNVGTTIGLIRIIISLGKGEEIDPFSIFNKENFKPFGNFFILLGIMTAGFLAAFSFMVLPGIVLAIAWNYAMYIMVQKEVTPTKALSLSYSITLGEKWKIFFIMLLIFAVAGAVCSLLILIPRVGYVLAGVASIFFMAFLVGIEAVIYKKLSQKILLIKD